jgi:hypothetical protein
MELISITALSGGQHSVGVGEIQSTEMSVVDQLVVINNGVTIRPPPVAFSIATTPWIINHNLGYVPQVLITDLAGNTLGVEKKITPTQIIVSPNAPATGYVHYY